MTVLVIAETPGVTKEQDEAMMKAVNLEADPPAGVRLRLAGPTETGWRIVTLWDSQDAFEAFFRERVAPALDSPAVQCRSSSLADRDRHHPLTPHRRAR